MEHQIDIKDTFKVDKEFNIIGRGLCIVIDLADNNYHDLSNKDLKQFTKREIIYKGKPYEIRGFETQGVEWKAVTKTAFLLKPITNANDSSQS